jgi:hypothetical protein
MRALIAISLAALAACLATACGDPAAKSGARITADGFRELAWGSTPSEATARYPDLAFVGYTLPPGESEPSRIYVREKENRELFGVTFDRVEYWFREGRTGDIRLHRVTALLRGSIGPRTIRSRCEAAFDQAAATIERLYGKPAEDRQAGMVQFGRFKDWHAGPMRIVLSRSGEDGDVEILMLELSR